MRKSIAVTAAGLAVTFFGLTACGSGSGADNPYANLLAVKRGNEDDPRVEKLAKLLVSSDVKKFIAEKYKGSVLPVTSG
jgi:ABC-type metal ion transport system substrate-binding protein